MATRTILFSPNFFLESKNDVKIKRITQNEEHFDIQLPKAYHDGISTWYSIAEATNFDHFC